MKKATTRWLVILGLAGLGIWLAARRAEAIPAVIGAKWVVGDILYIPGWGQVKILEVIEYIATIPGWEWRYRLETIVSETPVFPVGEELITHEGLLVDAGAVKVG